MLIFKLGFFVLPSTFFLALCSQVSNTARFIESGIALLYITSGAIAGKIMYDRYQQIQAMYLSVSTTSNANVISFANKMTSFVSIFLFMGFLFYLFLFLYQVDNYFLIAINIFVCGLQTLYIWAHNVISNHMPSVFYNKSLCTLRRWLASTALLVLILVTVFGLISIFVPTNGFGAKMVSQVCFFTTSLGCYMLTAMLGVLLLSFEVDNKYLNEDLESNSLLDNESLLKGPLTDTEPFFTIQQTNYRTTIDDAKIS